MTSQAGPHARGKQAGLSVTMPLSAMLIQKRTRTDESVKTPARLTAVGGIAAVSAAFLPGTSLAATQPGAAHLDVGRGSAGEVFVQTDNTSGNALAVYDRN